MEKCQGNLKELSVILCPHPSFLPASLQRRVGDPKPSRVSQFQWRFVWLKVARVRCQGCHFGEKYDFLSGQFVRGSSTLAILLQIVLRSSCRSVLNYSSLWSPQEFPKGVPKRDSAFMWQCCGAGQIQPLTLTQPSPAPQRLGFCCSFPHGTPSIPVTITASFPWEGGIGRWAAGSRGNTLSMKTLSELSQE